MHRGRRSRDPLTRVFGKRAGGPATSSFSCCAASTVPRFYHGRAARRRIALHGCAALMLRSAEFCARSRPRTRGPRGRGGRSARGGGVGEPPARGRTGRRRAAGPCRGGVGAPGAGRHHNAPVMVSGARAPAGAPLAGRWSGGVELPAACPTARRIRAPLSDGPKRRDGPRSARDGAAGKRPGRAAPGRAGVIRWTGARRASRRAAHRGGAEWWPYASGSSAASAAKRESSSVRCSWSSGSSPAVVASRSDESSRSRRRRAPGCVAAWIAWRARIDTCV